MKKRIIPLVLLLAMLLSLPAYAASPRVMTILPAISFDGTTANCRVSVSADRSTDQISAVIQLNEARFSNIFIEKRASTCPQSLEKSRLFSYALLVSECENFQNMKRIFLRKVVI